MRRIAALLLAGAVLGLLPAPSPSGAQGPAWSVRIRPGTTTGLLDGQVATVFVERAPAEEQVVVAQCGPSTGIDPSRCTSTGGSTGLDGRLTTRLVLRRALVTDAGTFDCAVEECLLQVFGVFGPTPSDLQTVSQPLAFAPTGTATGPGLHLSADTDLADGQRITASAWGLLPGQVYEVARCTGPDDVADCATQGSAPVRAADAVEAVAGADGTLTVPLAVSQCAACSVRVKGTSADAPLAFADPAAPYAWPPAPLLVRYDEPLVARGWARVRGAGFAPWSTFGWPALSPLARAQVCRSVPDPGPGDCTALTSADPPEDDTVVVVTPDDHGGTVDGRVRVARHIPTSVGTWDCAARGCTLALAQPDGATSRRVPLEWAPEWAPWPSAVAFLDGAVEPVAGRRLTPTARVQLASELGARTTTAVEALAWVARRSGHEATIGEVVRLYLAYLGRMPDRGGLDGWVDRLRAGIPPAHVARQLGSTAEVRAQQAGLSDAALVQQTYQRALGRPADAAGLAHWVDRLERGLPRWKLVQHFVASREMRQREAERAAAAIVLVTLFDADVRRVARDVHLGSLIAQLLTPA